MSKYSMIMSWSEDDQAYIDLWIETALEDGEVIPKPHLFQAHGTQRNTVSRS